jgi:hypothetical protein
MLLGETWHFGTVVSSRIETFHRRDVPPWLRISTMASNYTVPANPQKVACFALGLAAVWPNVVGKHRRNIVFIGVDGAGKFTVSVAKRPGTRPLEKRR